MIKPWRYSTRAPQTDREDIRSPKTAFQRLTIPWTYPVDFPCAVVTIFCGSTAAGGVGVGVRARRDIRVVRLLRHDGVVRKLRYRSRVLINCVGAITRPGVANYPEFAGGPGVSGRTGRWRGVRELARGQYIQETRFTDRKKARRTLTRCEKRVRWEEWEADECDGLGGCWR